MTTHCRIFALFVLLAAVAVHAQSTGPQLSSSLLDAIPFRLIGPASPAGRVWEVIGVPAQPKTFYVCTADGGVWKTTNFGTTLTPILNDQPAASCGPIAVAPSDPNIVWVGSGEPASTRASSLGAGVFKSTDGGQTWQFAGLRDTEETAAIVIDPRDANVVYVAALGHLWGRNPERGVFKTVDGGQHWEKVLYVDDSTGINDLQMDSHNPDALYAAAWQRLRWGDGDMTESGPGSGIFKSNDAGKTWTRLTAGLPADPMGKIHLAVAKKNSNIVYASVLTGEPAGGIGGGGGKRTMMTGGIFRSDDAGEHWQRVNPMMTSYYYQRIVVDPADDNRVWMPVFELWRSDDGGRTFVKHNMRHVHDDLHGMWIDPNDHDNMVLTGDGGVNTTLDGGKTWIQNVIPVAQFYEVDVDNQQPYFVYGGMQDTGHWTGPSQTYDNEGITNYDWIKLRFNGDGMAIHPDPRDPNVIYMVQEFGNTSRLDLKNWTRAELQPKQSDNPGWAKLHKFRWDWTPPMVLNQSDPDEFFLGANYLFRCRAANVKSVGSKHLPVKLDVGQYSGHRCAIISPDLTAQQELEKIDGAKQGYHSYGALFAVAQSPADRYVLWTGADDGPIFVTRDAGRIWRRVDPNICRAAPGKATQADAWRRLPSECNVTRGVVSHIEPSRTAAGTAYVAYDLHTLDDKRPYLFKTTDYGRTWTNITGDLPGFGPTYTIREDPNNPNVLLAGTEFGLYVSTDGGGHWVRWKSNLPTAAIRTLAIQPRDRELVVGTFGRAIWIGDLAPLEEFAQALAQPVYLFRTKPAIAHNIRYTYGATIEELNGDMFFRTENPPYGATITYFLREAASAPVRITVADSSGTTVRSMEGPPSAGLHRVQWDLETDAAKQQKPSAPNSDESELTLSEAQARRCVAPGNYKITLQTGTTSLPGNVEVRPESGDLQRVLTRK